MRKSGNCDVSIAQQIDIFNIFVKDFLSLATVLNEDQLTTPFTTAATG